MKNKSTEEVVGHISRKLSLLNGRKNTDILKLDAEDEWAKENLSRLPKE